MTRFRIWLARLLLAGTGHHVRKTPAHVPKVPERPDGVLASVEDVPGRIYGPMLKGVVKVPPVPGYTGEVGLG